MAEEKFIKYPNDLFVTNTESASQEIASSVRIGTVSYTHLTLPTNVAV